LPQAVPGLGQQRAELKEARGPSRLSLASVLLPSETLGQQPLGRHCPRMRTIQ